MIRQFFPFRILVLENWDSMKPNQLFPFNYFGFPVLFFLFNFLGNDGGPNDVDSLASFLYLPVN